MVGLIFLLYTSTAVLIYSVALRRAPILDERVVRLEVIQGGRDDLRKAA